MKKTLAIFAMFLMGCIAAELPATVQSGRELAGQPTVTQVASPSPAPNPATFATIHVNGMAR